MLCNFKKTNIGNRRKSMKILIRTKRPLWGFKTFGFYFLIASVFINTGCEPLRKKFIRAKKKDQKIAIEPVFEPIEYPSKAYSPEVAYQYHYSLWQVWSKDLVTVLEEESSSKRKLYNITQMITQTQEMENLLIGEKKEKLSRLKARLEQMKEKMERSVVLADSSKLLLDLKVIDRNFRREFKPQYVKDNLTTAQ